MLPLLFYHWQYSLLLSETKYMDNNIPANHQDIDDIPEEAEEEKSLAEATMPSEVLEMLGAN